MNTLIQFKTATPWRRGFLVIPLLLCCFALTPAARAQESNPGSANTAEGIQALAHITTGGWNTGLGFQALFNDTTSGANTATGYQALFNNTGGGNTAVGSRALRNNTGSFNTALGGNAGLNLTTGNRNIDIANPGSPGDSKSIRIGTIQDFDKTFIAGIFGGVITLGIPVIVDFDGHLGTLISSERFKADIKPMDKASEALLALKPVTFRYKQEFDPKGIPQFGLVAEAVEKVNPDLVVRDDQGKALTVRYEAVNAMLLNEFLKEHRKVEKQEATITQLKSTVAQQQKGMEGLAASLKEQASQIQKVSAQLEVNKPAPQMVLNNP